MAVSTGKITGLIVGVVMMVVLFSVASTMIPTGSLAVYNLFHGLTNTTVLGTGAVTLAGQIPGFVGWFWVLGPFLLVIAIIFGLFTMGKNRRR